MGENSPQNVHDASRRDRDATVGSSIYEAIQAIEAVVQKEKWPARIQGMWAQVKQATFHKEGIGRENTSSTDMQEIKAQIRGLAVTIKDLANTAIL